MNYLISEEALNRLESARGQLRLIVDLLTPVDSHLNQVNSNDMLEFIDAQKSSITAVLEEVANRPAPAPQLVPAMVPTDLLVRLITAASGEYIAQEDLQSLNGLLLDAASQDVAYGNAARAFYAALMRQGYDVTSTVRNGEGSMAFMRKAQPPQTMKRKRDKLATASA